MDRRYPVIAGLVAVLLVATTAQAQTPPGQVPQTQPPTPLLPPSTGVAPSGKESGSNPLSEQLSRSGGVIKPPDNVDRKIEAPTPDPGPRSMPVVPPPGSPGGNPGVKPK